jgi:hypothetical protein
VCVNLDSGFQIPVVEQRRTRGEAIFRMKDDNEELKNERAIGRNCVPRSLILLDGEPARASRTKRFGVGGLMVEGRT